MVQNIGAAQYALNKKLDEGKKKKCNINPFEGPVDDEVYISDADGNIIKVPAGYQLGGSKDDKFIQLKDPDGRATGPGHTAIMGLNF